MHYWTDKKPEVFGMIRQLERPIVFVMLSASEVRCYRLIALLENLRVQGSPDLERPVEDLRLIDAADLVNDDHVDFAVYVYRLFYTILTLLKDKVVYPFKPCYVVS
ncbi:hypothetical protein HPB48_018529 [Haemaphysalis longicornis]|uniref:Uncharacterized protein n=1 Tax=Haemaphysalis longicornis TaxID=44386 RepID=A0A9J6FQX3_HAELO|nr:hypothetical protein HPB48_018529 [Haemaphysalis longicornis]